MEETSEELAVATAPVITKRERSTDFETQSERPAKIQNSREYDSPRGQKRGRSDAGEKGRKDYFSANSDKRQKIENSREKGQKDGNRLAHGRDFSKEEIEAESRRPKRKVAVMIGYSGTGYKGMQVTPNERTIEGDLFKAFIDAGAISKANADDPKKASLVRCARTDKGVHAGGNVISLKLIVEDEDIVEKINQHLSPQIRVWGIERTTGGFSSYKACDSRWYEYLMPAYAFLPPHPNSFLGRKLVEHAKEAGDIDSFLRRQADVVKFWEQVEETAIKPVVDGLDEDIRNDVLSELRIEDDANANAGEKTALSALLADEGSTTLKTDATDAASSKDTIDKKNDGDIIVESSSATADQGHERQSRIRAAKKLVREAYMAVKRRYRLSPHRIERIQKALNKYVGTLNFHNYTIKKDYTDPSAKRHIKSFQVNPEPILIGTGPPEEQQQWLSMKVHGQSFMMHQIRKMVGMATLMVRCGTNLTTLSDSFLVEKFNIPKVPGLGLLLERPVFDSYNKYQAAKFARNPIGFEKYEKEIDEFKNREIYQRIFREEEEKNEFSRFFNHVDNYKMPHFLFLTSKGLEATKVDPLGPKYVEDDEGQLAYEDN